MVKSIFQHKEIGHWRKFLYTQTFKRHLHMPVGMHLEERHSIPSFCISALEVLLTSAIFVCDSRSTINLKIFIEKHIGLKLSLRC